MTAKEDSWKGRAKEVLLNQQMRRTASLITYTAPL